MEMTCFCPQYYWNFLMLLVDIIEHYCVYFVIKKQFSCSSLLLWRPIWPKNHKNVFMVMRCVCIQYYWNIHHPLTVYCTSISTLPTFQCSICASPHQGMVDYTGHFMTYVILSFCRFFSSYECKNEKWPTCCGVNFRLYQNMSNFIINYESVSARPLFWLNPQPDPSTLYSYNPNVGIFVIKSSCRIVVDENTSIHKTKTI